jgi:hypothetical protein
MQLFVTTHSYHDALRFFSFYAKEDELRCYLLKRSEGVVEVEKVEDKLEKILREMYEVPK